MLGNFFLQILQIKQVDVSNEAYSTFHTSYARFQIHPLANLHFHIGLFNWGNSYVIVILTFQFFDYANNKTAEN
jgi:hypothetical protein